MGYDLYIGEARIRPGYSHDETDMRIVVDTLCLEEAPRFSGFSGEQKGANSRSPSYSTWADFCREVGLYEMFYGPDGRDGLIGRHPGAASLFPEHLAQVREALARHLAKPWPTPERICGWESQTKERDWMAINRNPDPRYDGAWARLVWLEWWIDWALRTCANPCFANS